MKEEIYNLGHTQNEDFLKIQLRVEEIKFNFYKLQTHYDNNNSTTLHNKLYSNEESTIF